MSYFPEPGSHIKDKDKVVSDLSNSTTKKGLDHATATDTSELAAEKGFIALKRKVGKLDINKLVNVATSLNNLKTKVDYWDAGKWKTVPIDLNKIKWCSEEWSF